MDWMNHDVTCQSLVHIWLLYLRFRAWTATLKYRLSSEIIMIGTGREVFNYLSNNHFHMTRQIYIKFQKPSTLTWIQVFFKSVPSLLFLPLILWGGLHWRSDSYPCPNHSRLFFIHCVEFLLTSKAVLHAVAQKAKKFKTAWPLLET